MSTIGSYTNRSFSETQKFLVLDPATGTTSLVLGSDLVSYITPRINSVIAETTRLAAENTDYAVGEIIQTSGGAAPGDGLSDLYLVVASGEGDFPMINGNELLILPDDGEIRADLASDAAGEGAALVSMEGGPTVEVAVNNRVTRVSSRTEMKAYDVPAGYQFSLEEGGRSGIFVVKAGTPPSDPQEGIYVVLDNGNYAMRRYDAITPGSGVSAEWFGAVGDNSTDDTTAIQAATDFQSNNGGGAVFFGAEIYAATRLEPRSNVTWKGTWGASYLRCTDSTTIDANSTIGSFVKAPDDGNRVVRFGIEGVGIITALSGTAAAQDTFQDICGLNLAACERTTIKDTAIFGFGQGAIIFARAEAGAEGLGFVSTTQDGNYNTCFNINIGACGKYNTDEAAIWFKYKANSNKFFGVYCKGTTFVSFGIRHGNDNLISGSTTEAGKTIVYFGPNGVGNVITGARAEVISSHAYDFDNSANFNSVIGGYYTGVSGNFANNIENTEGNTVLDAQNSWIGVREFPPSTSVATTHFQQVSTFRAINGDNNRPLWIKSPNYNTDDYPVIRFWNSKISPISGDELASIDALNSDTSGGAAGVSARMIALIEGVSGQTAWSFWTGQGSTAAEKFRIKANGELEMFEAGAGLTMRSPNGTAYKLSVDDAGTLVIT